MKHIRLLLPLIAILLTSAAGCTSSEPAPTPNIAATIEAAVKDALSNVNTPTKPNIDATVAAGVKATIEALPQPTPTPTPAIAPPPLPLPTATAAPTPTSTSIPTATPSPISTPTATASPTPSPTPTPTATATPIPTPTPTPTPSPSLTETIATASPGIVRIDTDLGVGSGIIIETDKSDLSALVLTSYPVIENASYITITVSNSATYDGVLIGADPQRGLALLKICCKDGLHALSFGDSSTTLAGTEVIAIGYVSAERTPTVTRGSISALRYQTELNRWIIQTDSPTNPGNSGGPLLSLNGEVLGLNTSGIRGSGSGITIEGFGFAISERTLTSVLPILKAGAMLTPQPGAAGGSYLNEEHWYSINIPSDWRIDSSDSDAVAMWDPSSDVTVWISVDEIDPDVYPTLDTYIAQSDPAPAEGWINFLTTSQRRIITNLPIDIEEFVYTFEFQGQTYLGKAHWYLLGKQMVKVTAIATSAIWTFQLHSQIRSALETAQQSFQPFSYTSNVYGYSLAHPLTWNPSEGPGYDYQVFDPLSGSTSVYVRINSVSGFPSIDIYGASQSFPNAEVLSRQVVFPKRPNPNYRIDYSYTSQTTGNHFRVAVLIAISGKNAIWIYVQDYSESWSQISSLVDDIFLRSAFKP